MRPDRRPAATIRRPGARWPAGLAWLAFALVATWRPGIGAVDAGERTPAADVLRKVKPAVVIVTTKVFGEVRLTCPDRAPQRVVPEPIQAHGTGFLITADGYLVTNGHVVQPYHDPDDSEHRGALLREAIEKACVPQDLSEQQKRAAVRGLAARLAKSADVEVRKSLTVVLSNRDTFVADVKAYSPPLAERPGKQSVAKGAPALESGKDVAILKIDARNLPTVPLGDSDRVQLGQAIYLLGFPGVVMYHDLLDKRSAVEASITAGQISSVKRDARGAPVIQTDAAASWGNSGGPAIDDQGRVVGVLTFISLTSDDTQAIQGFNFLVPASTVLEFARAAGADLGAPSPFNAVWHDAVDRFRRKDWGGAQVKLDAAARLVPNLPDVRRLQAETEIHLLQDKRPPTALLIGAGGAAVLALVGGACWWERRRRRARRAPANAAVQAQAPALLRPVVRVAATDLARALAQRTDLVIVDVREASTHASSPVQAKGAVRASVADVVETASTLAREQGIILYCDLPGEEASTEAARRLMAAGYTRVAVLAGGFAAWEAASLPLERTPHARGLAESARRALPASRVEAVPSMQAEVDLPVGVKGGGPYFNARATRLGLTGLSLRSPTALTVGQRVRLTVFIPGEALEIGGQVVSAEPAVGNGGICAAEVTFDALPEEHATALEGLILAQRTTR